MSPIARFTIRAVTALTGINANTLRAWERRYGLVIPERTPKGYRLFSERDVQRLRLIRHAMEQGIPVGRVREHLDDPRASDRLARALERAPRREAGSRSVEVSLAAAGLSGTTTIRLPDLVERGPGASLAELSERIEEAALRMDREALDRAFSHAVGLYSVRRAFCEALAPALARVGERYLRDVSGIAEEHFLTSYARDRLASALTGLRPLHQAPRVLCACVPGDRHEIGLMLLALELGLEGVSTLYLGADLPFAALVRAAQGRHLRAIVLSATLAVREAELDAARRALVAEGVRAPLLLGGPAAWRQRASLESRGLDVLPLDTYEAARELVGLVSGD